MLPQERSMVILRFDGVVVVSAARVGRCKSKPLVMPAVMVLPRNVRLLSCIKSPASPLLESSGTRLLEQHCSQSSGTGHIVTRKWGQRKAHGLRPVGFGCDHM